MRDDSRSEFEVASGVTRCETTIDNVAQPCVDLVFREVGTGHRFS